MLKDVINSVVKTLGYKIEPVNTQKSILGDMSSMGFSFLGNSLSSCGKVVIDLNTMYKIWSTNKMAWAYIDKIANMVGRYGFDVIDENWEKMEMKKTSPNSKILRQATNFLKVGMADNKSYELFRWMVFNQIFCSGECTLTANALNPLFKADLNGWYVKILDTRGIRKTADDYGDIEFYEYVTRKGREKFLPEQVLNYIAFPNTDNPIYGISKFNRIYMEAITNFEANSRQMYFFKNNAVPNLMVMVDQEKVADKKAIDALKAMRDKKFTWSENASKPLITDIVKDIKQLDVSNVEMDFISLRKENDKDFAVIFLMDTRLIGLSKETGSFWEIESTTIRQGNDQIDAYGSMLSEIITLAYKKFIDDKFPYSFKCKNAYFTDDLKEREMWLKEVDGWVRTQNQYIVDILGWEASDQEWMDEFKVRSAWVPKVDTSKSWQWK